MSKTLIPPFRTFSCHTNLFPAAGGTLTCNEIEFVYNSQRTRLGDCDISQRTVKMWKKSCEDEPFSKCYLCLWLYYTHTHIYEKSCEDKNLSKREIPRLCVSPGSTVSMTCRKKTLPSLLLNCIFNQS